MEAPPSEAPNLVAILANPLAGRASSRELLDELVTELRARGMDATICWQRDHLTELIANDLPTLRCVVAAGGDGTFNELLNRAPNVPLAVLPIGNENLVAKHFGFPRSASRLAQIIATGHQHRIDVGMAGQRRFALMASAGFDAEVVHRVHRHRSGHVTKRSYAWQIIQAADSYSFPLIDVEIIDTGERLRGAMVFAFNMPRYGIGIPIAPLADPADGWLDLYVFQRPGIANLLRYGLAAMMRRHGRLGDVQHRRIRRAQLWSKHPVPVQADGDPAGRLPMMIETVRDAVSVLTPMA